MVLSPLRCYAVSMVLLFLLMVLPLRRAKGEPGQRALAQGFQMTITLALRISLHPRSYDRKGKSIENCSKTDLSFRYCRFYVVSKGWWIGYSLMHT